ncbi:STE3-domain-containing protein [Artomyces pyxidatus]|uniref:STE3-domain-containing protein n=1 Tax=Artomyces pyxidatus TaxID=48021 RepID=A0ACB8SZ07_9AGAM|nr:STE3-domain-containing protein [Artomyces pyxidatus]
MVQEQPNSIFSAFAFVGFIFSILPLPWRFEATNTGTCLFVFWSALGCLTLFINSRIWDGNTFNSAPLWCDFSTRIIVAEYIAIPATLLCIIHRVFSIMNQGKVATRRDALMDISLGFLFPMLVSLLSFIVQGHRFEIYEDLGCWPAIVNTPLTYVLLCTWPFVFDLVSVIYGVSTMLCYLNYCRTDVTVPTNSNPIFKLDNSLFLRLILLCNINLLLLLPFGLYLIVINITSPTFGPWIGWKDIHRDFTYVPQVPADIWKANWRSRMDVELFRWSHVVWAFLFFALFGFSKDRLRRYRLVWEFVESLVARLLHTFRHSLPPTPDERQPDNEVSVHSAESVSFFSLDVMNKSAPTNISAGPSVCSPPERIPVRSRGSTCRDTVRRSTLTSNRVPLPSPGSASLYSQESAFRGPDDGPRHAFTFTPYRTGKDEYVLQEV